MNILSLLLFAIVAVSVKAAPAADEVKGLPGWYKPLPSKHYSGYLDLEGATSQGKHLHYLLVESEKDSATAPVVFWFNGGPGCSSMDGYLYEHGPLHVIEPLQYGGPDGNIPDMYLNPYRWSLNANVVYLEAPACVGFSYADSEAGCFNNDAQQAVDNLSAVKQFYKKFPEFAQNDLHITGESYAGMYVPTLAAQILKSNESGATTIPLKGIMVGNGVIGDEPQNQVEIFTEFYYGHGLFSMDTYKSVKENCGANYENTQDFQCQQAFDESQSNIGNINTYDVYDVCESIGFPGATSQSGAVDVAVDGMMWRRPPTDGEVNRMKKNMKASQRAKDAARRAIAMGVEPKGSVPAPVAGPIPCINAGAADALLNLPSVRKALNVKSAAEIGDWTICTSKLQYKRDSPSLLPLYKDTLIPKIRVTIYNGDADGCVPYIGNELWTKSLGFQVEQAWRPWSVDKQVAGYVTVYEQGFQFITVKGSGHMVPQYRPKAALAMFQRFIANEEY